MVDRAQQLALGAEVPALGVTELFEDVVASDHLIGQGASMSGRATIVFELGEGASDDVERRLVVEVVDQVGGEVVGRSKRGVQVGRRRERDASHVVQREVARRSRRWRGPRRRALAVRLVRSSGRTRALVRNWRPASEYLVKRSRATERAGMLTPSASVSVAKTTARRLRSKHVSTISRKAGTIPAWCIAMPRRNASMKSAYSRAWRSSSENSKGALPRCARSRDALRAW